MTTDTIKLPPPMADYPEPGQAIFTADQMHEFRRQGVAEALAGREGAVPVACRQCRMVGRDTDASGTPHCTYCGIENPDTTSATAPAQGERETFEAWFKEGVGDWQRWLVRSTRYPKQYDDSQTDAMWDAWQARAALAALAAQPAVAPAQGEREGGVDLRGLFVKYIKHVGEEEGTSFMPSFHPDGGFTEAEIEMLNTLDRESMK